MSPEDFLVEIAVRLYDAGRLTMGQARKLARLDQISFQREMSQRNVYIKYDVKDLLKDMETLNRLNNRDRSK